MVARYTRATTHAECSVMVTHLLWEQESRFKSDILHHTAHLHSEVRASGEIVPAELPSTFDVALKKVDLPFLPLPYAINSASA